MTARQVYCKLCGKKGTLLQPSARMWHQDCPKRGIRQAAPEYVENRSAEAPSTLPERR